MILSATGNLQAQVMEQRALWRRQANSIPGLLGGKAVWLTLVLELVDQVGAGHATNLEATADLSFDVGGIEPRQGGATPKLEAATWKQYYGFLRGLRLAEIDERGLRLTAAGHELRDDPAPVRLATVLADRIRLFAETLSLIAADPRTVEEVDEQLRTLYHQTWKSLGKTRSRMDWLEVLGMIEGVGNRRWKATDAGRFFLEGRMVVSPSAFEGGQQEDVELADAPPEISELLEGMSLSGFRHDARSTYNLWVPSPQSNPNKVENLRIIVNSAFSRVSREELFGFICTTFDLKRSSVESMMPFMKSAGLIAEVARGIYEATSVARAWIESDDDLNFVRILHANMRFVGEMLRFAEVEVSRNELYAEGKRYGLNTEKCRWIASFLLGTGLLEETGYLKLKATSRGVALRPELPLADPPMVQPDPDGQMASEPVVEALSAAPGARDRLGRLSREPLGEGKGSGRAFEDAIRDTFVTLGFVGRVISGSGDTDVLVEWSDADGNLRRAIIEAKSSASGVIHNQSLSATIETHKVRHDAGHVAIVAPGFSGEAIQETARNNAWILIDADRLGALAEAALVLGLRPYEVGSLFDFPDGVSVLEDMISSRERELEIVSFVLKKMAIESKDTGEALSARDIYRDGRGTGLSPGVDEVVRAFETLSRFQVDLVRRVAANDDAKLETFVLGDAASGAAHLRAFACSIERGLDPQSTLGG